METTKKTETKNDPASAGNSLGKVKLERTATANWHGNLIDGDGTLSTQSEMLMEINYSFKTRFDRDEPGTNPEELLAAAHAACFTMSVAAILAGKECVVKSLVTEAVVSLSGLNIIGVHLNMTAIIDGITSAEFTFVAQDAAKNCLISKILNVPVSINAHF